MLSPYCRLLIWASPAILFFGASWANAKVNDPAENQCIGCHEGVVKNFSVTRHGKAMQFQTGRFQGDCQVCHGDATAHIESADPAKISNPANLSAVEASETCLKCHQNEKHQMSWRGSQHDLSGNSCLSCHSVHHAKSEGSLLKARTQAEVCFTCHPNVRKAQLQRSTHLFRDERLRNRLECASCHNVHGTQTEKLISANSVNDKCYSCHAEKRGPFLWEHSPAKENCMVCHSPHGSNQPKLLVMRPPMLCQSCHIQGRHQTVAARPNAMFVINRACVNCHPQIHGSNHPSGVILQR